MKAWNPKITSATQELVQKLSEGNWYHSIQLPDGTVTPGLQTLETLEWRLAQFDLPQDLRGARVLDIGCWDGWFSFEMERRGASVVSVDMVANDNYRLAAALMNSQAEYRIADLLTLTPAHLGRFDIVLFLGVLYHLKHPLLGLERAAALSHNIVCVETYVTETEAPFASRPLCEYYEHDELCGQFDNWSGPNVACLLAWCRSTGFATVSLRSVRDFRAHVLCTRQLADIPVGQATAVITGVHNSVTRGHEFVLDQDDYISVWFETSAQLTGALYARVGADHVPAVNLRAVGGSGWHAVFKLPFGLQKSRQPLALLGGGLAETAAVDLFVGFTPDERLHALQNGPIGQIQIEVLTDGATWERNRCQLAAQPSVSVWLSGANGALGRASLSLSIGNILAPAIYASAPGAQAHIQANFFLPRTLAPGHYEAFITGPFGRTPAVPLEVY